MRQCTASTVNKIARLDKLPTKPAWLHLAIWDAQNYRPISAERERRMCAALGIDIPQRRRYWRPCLPDGLTLEQRQVVVDFAQSLLER